MGMEKQIFLILVNILYTLKQIFYTLVLIRLKYFHLKHLLSLHQQVIPTVIILNICLIKQMTQNNCTFCLVGFTSSKTLKNIRGSVKNIYYINKYYIWINGDIFSQKKRPSFPSVDARIELIRFATPFAISVLSASDATTDAPKPVFQFLDAYCLSMRKKSKII